MKVLICLVICFGLGNSQLLTWNEYKTKFGKTYATAEDNSRKQYFNMQQMNQIEPHKTRYQSGLETYDLDYNALTDAGYAYNYKSCFERIDWPTDFPKGAAFEVNKENLPATFELEASKVLVMDQTNNGNWTYMVCNYGWAFVVAKAVEIFAINNSIKPSSISLSPQQLIDCWNGDNCKKGIPHKALEYVTNHNQVIYTDETYSYIGQKNEFCTPDRKDYPQSGAIRKFSILDDKATEEDIKGVLVNTKSPLIFELNPFSEKFLNYKTGVFNSITSGLGSHFMLIVGYGTETIKDKDYPYWKVLNSWGTTWGENGYMKLLRTNAPIKKFVFPSKY